MAITADTRLQIKICCIGSLEEALLADFSHSGSTRC